MHFIISAEIIRAFPRTVPPFCYNIARASSTSYIPPTPNQFIWSGYPGLPPGLFASCAFANDDHLLFRYFQLLWEKHIILADGMAYLVKRSLFILQTWTCILYSALFKMMASRKKGTISLHNHPLSRWQSQKMWIILISTLFFMPVSQKNQSFLACSFPSVLLKVCQCKLHYEKEASAKLDEETAAYWKPWSSWSECSRTCDGGASFQYRQCIEKGFCSGQKIRYRLCNIQVICSSPSH